MKTKTRPSVNLFLLTFFSFLLSISSAFEKKNKVFEAAELLINQINKNVHANDKTVSFHVSEVLREISKYGHKLPLETRSKLEGIGFNFNGPIVRTDRPQNLDQTLDEGFFRFHYTLTGNHAVSSIDSDANGVSDYIDFIAKTFKDISEIDFDSLGFSKPPGDSWYTQFDNGGSDHYDIYIYELESGYYGYVQGEDYASNVSASTRGDNEFSVEKESRAMTTFMALRNNYDDFSGFEEEIIEVTAAHEFFHAVQYGYDGWEAGWLLEATAVWMEEYHYDEVNDCYQFLKEFFESPELSINHDTNRGYGSYIYFSYLTENLTDSGLIKSIFNRSRELDSYAGDLSIPAVKMGLIDHGLDFQKATNSFFIANGLLESSEFAGIYRYTEADSFPMKKPTFTKTITKLTNDQYSLNNQDLEMNASRYYKVDTSDSSWNFLTIDLQSYGNSKVDLDLHAIINSQRIIPYNILKASDKALNVSMLDSVTFVVSSFGPDSGSVSYDLKVKRIPSGITSSNDFALIMPDSAHIIEITKNNYMNELVLGWESPENFSGNYYFLLTDSLDLLYSSFYGRCGSKSNSCSIPYHLLENYLYNQGLERVSGTWDIIAIVDSTIISSINGPFKLTIDGSAVSVNKEKLLIPDKFVLYSNYPNPFNPSTNISYQLPNQSHVLVQIYDILGNKIKTLVNESQSPGKKTVLWDGINDLGMKMSGGVYIYQIHSGDFTDTRKMLLLK